MEVPYAGARAVVLDDTMRADLPAVTQELKTLISLGDVGRPTLCVAVHDDSTQLSHQELIDEITAACSSTSAEMKSETVVKLCSNTNSQVQKSFAIKSLLDSNGVASFIILTVKDSISTRLVALDTVFTSAYDIKVKLYGGAYVDIPASLKTVTEGQRSTTLDECSQFLSTFHPVPGENVEVVHSSTICDRVFFHGFSTRKGGCSSYPPVATLNLLFRPVKRDPLPVVQENRRRLLQAVGAPPTHRLIFPKVNHTNSVWVMGEPEPPEYDAIVSNQPGLAIAAPAADCVTIIMGAAERCVFAAVHSGWKGTVGNIVRSTVEAMTRRLGCKLEEIKAAIGPSIGACCYEVGKDCEDLFRADPLLRHCIKIVEGKSKRHLDLQMAVGLQMEEAGLLSENIDRGPGKLCTYCHRDRFYSYRRDRAPFGTHVGFIGLR